jgi:hypothetical protein
MIEAVLDLDGMAEGDIIATNEVGPPVGDE